MRVQGSGKKALGATIAVFMMIVMASFAFAAGSKEGAQAASGKKVEINFMHFFTVGDARNGVIVKVLQEFAAAHPNIVVKEDAIAHDLYQTKVLTLGSSGQLPDVFFMKGNWAEEFSKAGSIVPVDDILNADPAFKKAFLPAALANHIYDGKIYSLPYTIDLNALVYYNKPLFDKYNLRYPETFDELIKVIKVFRANGVIPIALGNKDQWLVPTGWLSCLTALAGGPDYMNNLALRAEKYTTQPYIEALGALRAMVDANAFNEDFNTIDNYQMYSLYGEGNAAMMSAGSWAASTMVANLKKEIIAATRVGVMPAFSSGKGKLGTVAGGSGWGVNINSKISGEKKDAAIKLMKAMSDQQFGKHLIEIANMPPAVADVKYDQSKVSSIFKQILDIEPKAIVTPVFDQVIHPELIDEQNKTTQAVMAKEITPEEAAKRVQAIKDRLLKGK